MLQWVSWGTLGHLGTQFGNHGSEPLYKLFPLLEHLSVQLLGAHPSAPGTDMVTSRSFSRTLETRLRRSVCTLR